MCFIDYLLFCLCEWSNSFFLFCMIKSFNCVVILLYFSTHRESYLITFSSPVTGIKSWHCTFLQTTDISNLDFYIHVILNSDNMYVS